jgi:hypothetical protein
LGCLILLLLCSVAVIMIVPSLARNFYTNLVARAFHATGTRLLLVF